MNEVSWFIFFAFVLWWVVRAARVQWRLRGSSSRGARYDTMVSREVSATLTSCRACESSLENHLFWEAISVALPDEHSAAWVPELVRRHSWSRLRGVRIFNPESDALVYWFIECPRTRKSVLYEVHSRAGFDENDSLSFLEVLDESDTEEVIRELDLRSFQGFTLHE